MTKTNLPPVFRNLIGIKILTPLRILGFTIGIAGALIISIFLQRDFNNSQSEKNCNENDRVEQNIDLTSAPLFISSLALPLSKAVTRKISE